MKIFTRIYDACIRLAKNRFAPFFLVGNSFIESIFWPIPVDIILAPMCLAKPNRALHYALWATIASVLGALVGYGLGFFLYDPYVAEFIHWAGYTQTMQKACTMLKDYGVIFIILGSFTPLPYKIVAVSCGLIASQQVALGAGAGQLNIFVFALVSLIGRGLRFFLIAEVIKLGGEAMEKKLRHWIDIIGWICLVLSAIAMCIYFLMV